MEINLNAHSGNNLGSFIIEPTNFCNQACITCTRATDTTGRCGKMSLENFKKIIDKLPKVEDIKLQGMGEPTLNSELSEMAKYAHNKAKVVWTTTNGTNYSDNMFDGLDAIVISINADNRIDYLKIARVDNFHLTETNIPKIIKYANNKKIPMAINTVKGDHNTEFAEKFKKLYGKASWIANQSDWFSYRFEEDFKRIINNKKCRSFSPFISWEGYVTLCCVRMDPRVLNFGNILEQSWDEIWGNPEYKWFRENAGKCAYCKGCVS